MIKKIVAFSMMAMMAVVSLSACGGGSDDNNNGPVIPAETTGNVVTVASGNSVVATAASEQFNLVAPTAQNQERTISGFEYGKDHIAVPSAIALNAAPLTAGDTTSTDSVDLSWTVDGITTAVHMTNLDTQTRSQLLANSDFTTIYTKY